MHFLRRTVVAAVIGVPVLVLAACGSSGAKKAAAVVAPTTTTAPGRGAALQAFRTCMADHGVNLPQRQPGAGRSGTSTTDNPAAGSTSAAGSGSSSATTDPGGGGRGFGNFQTPPPGVDATTYQTALNACRSQLPTGTGQGNPQFASARKAYATCLSQHGVTVTNDAQGNPNLQAIDRTTPAFQSANQTCQALLPQRPPATTTTTAG